MSFSISKTQQKIFIENFIAQTLTIALQLVDQGKDYASPGETMQTIGQAVIAQLRVAAPTAKSDTHD